MPRHGGAAWRGGHRPECRLNLVIISQLLHCYVRRAALNVEMYKSPSLERIFGWLMQVHGRCALLYIDRSGISVLVIRASLSSVMNHNKIQLPYFPRLLDWHIQYHA